MKRILCILLLILAACSSEKPKPAVSKEPVSVRGWIEDVEGSVRAANPDLETARRTQIFQATSIWVENADYVSGGVAENGSFILLDVPPGNLTIGFEAPGAEQARVVLQNIPGNADVFIPGLILKKDGVRVMKPEAVRVRVPARIEKETRTGRMAVVAGLQVPIVDVPIAAMIDRHDYPKPEGFRPVATFK